MTGNETCCGAAGTNGAGGSGGFFFHLSGDGWGNGAAYSVHTNNPDVLGAGDVMKVTRRDYLGILSNLVTDYTYEPRYHFVLTAKNPRGYTTKYFYDYMDSASVTDAFAGNLVRVELPQVTLGQPNAQDIKTYMTYNEYGQLVSSTDGEGNVTLNKYYTDGLSHDGFLYQRVSAYGVLDLTSEFDWNQQGDMITQWPPRAFEAGVTKDDFKTTYTVNELDQVVKVTGRKLRTTGSDRKDTYFYYDANGNQTDSWDEYVTSGGTEPTDPADFTSMASFTKPSAAMAAGWIQSSTTYDILNRPTSRTVDAIPGGTTERFTSYTFYDRNDNVTDSVSPLGNRSRRVYDERDLTYQSIAGADSDVAGTFTTNYDANGNVATSVDARGNSSSYVYDGFDRSTKATDPAGSYRETDYDVNGNVIESRAKDSLNTLLAKSNMYFDEIDRTYKSERMAKNYNGNDIGDGLNTVTTLFDKNSRVTSSTDDNGVTMLRFYDAANRMFYTRDPAGNEVENSYNADGAVTKTTFREISGLNGAVEKSHVEYILDKMNRKINFRDQRYGSFDTEVDYAYDSRNRLVTFTDAGSITTDYVYDSLDRNTRTIRKPVLATDTTWTITDTAYDKQSRVTKRTIYESPDDVTPTNPQDTTYEYDERDRLKLVRRADGDIFRRFYDANGNIIEWRNPNNDIVNQTFDARNLMLYRNITRGTNTIGATYEAYQYDGLGRLNSCSNYEGSNLITASQWQYNTQSQPEQFIQTIANHSGTILGTYTTGAEYTASGLNSATLYSSGMRVEHTFDERNRLLNSYDVSHNQDIATYTYSGSRLVERINGNGTVTEYEYESSGCGCGGFSSFCTGVKHSRVSDGELLFDTQRRYDVRGRVMTERRAHEGDVGMVYRYDDTDRLTTMFTGADLYDSAIDTHVTGSGPTVYGIKRTWNLDPRGNRSGSQGVRDIDDGNGGASTTILDTSVTVSTDKMNLYTDVGGKAYEFDAMEQMTRDRSTETYMRYDWRGQLWKSDINSDMATPERFYTYDCQGRRKVEERWYDASTHNDSNILNTTFCACATGNCGGDIAGDFTETIRTLDANGLLLSTDEHMIGLGAHGTGSSSATHPAAVFPAGGKPAGDELIAHRLDYGGDVNIFWRCEDQLNSCVGETDVNGWRTFQNSYLAFGECLQSRVLYDGAKVRWDSIDIDTPLPGLSTINLANADLGTDLLNGALLYLARPGEAVDRHMEANVVDTTSKTIVIDDPSGAFAGALAEATDDPTHFAPPIEDFVIFAFNDSKVPNAPTYQTQGTWTTGPTTGSGKTKFTDADADDNGGGFASWMVGCLLVPDVNIGAPLVIVNVPSATEVEVGGTATGVGSNGSQYLIYAAPFTDPVHGTLQTDAFKAGSAYLWAGYRYQPPQMGFWVDPPGGPSLGVYGAATGSNKLGQYYAWNRIYDINTGRWTTPDPMATPWWNLNEYTSEPIESSDQTGLKKCSKARALVLATAVAAACGVASTATLIACFPEVMTVILVLACIGEAAATIYGCTCAVKALVDDCGDGITDEWVESWEDFFSVGPVNPIELLPVATIGPIGKDFQASSAMTISYSARNSVTGSLRVPMQRGLQFATPMNQGKVPQSVIYKTSEEKPCKQKSGRRTANLAFGYAKLEEVSRSV